jgi:Zn-finger nucleic acid-binding protein
MDPYRFSQQTGTCPRCQNETAGDGEMHRLVCVRGCGEWYSKEKLGEMFAWDDLNRRPAGIGLDGQHARPSAWPWGTALCPICQTEMAVGFRDDLRFDYCGQHGVWLDAGEIERFTQLFRLP